MQKMPQDPFIIVDGSAFLFRAFYGLPPLTAANGQQTGAIYGVINMLRKLLAQFKPSKMVVVFDAKQKTFRHQLYPEYKANRTVMPDELAAQIVPLHNLIKALGLPLLVLPGIEADDIIGTLAVQAQLAGLFTIIATGDKDLAQLVCDNIVLINTMNDTVLDAQGVTKKFGIAPNRIVDYLALTGDQVDNIPGIANVGPKTALKWLELYGSLAGIIANITKITGKVGDNLRASLDKLPLYQELVTIKTDVEIPVAPMQLQVQAPNIVALLPQLKALNFNSWLKEYGGGGGWGGAPTAPIADAELVKAGGLDASPITPAAVLTNAASENGVVGAAPAAVTQAAVLANTPSENGVWGEAPAAVTQAAVLANTPSENGVWGEAPKILPPTASQLAELIKTLQNIDLLAIYLVTNDAPYMQAELLGIALAIDQQHTWYIPFINHNIAMGPEAQLAITEVLAALQVILQDPKITKVMHNIKHSLHILANYGINCVATIHDPMLAAYVLASTTNHHDLSTLAARYLQQELMPLKELIGTGAKQIAIASVAATQLGQFATQYASSSLALHQYLLQQLQELPSLLQVYTEIEMPLARVLFTMERNGVLIDATVLAAQSIALAARLEELAEQAYHLSGMTFNLNSPKQLQEVLYGQLGLPILQKTPTGQPSTAEAVLQELALDFPLPKLILEYRSLSKLKSTYTDALPQQIQAGTGRVHTTYQQAVTVTGRLSSTDPNLQNIPIKSEAGKKVRAAFIAKANWSIMAIDYSQIELRIMAHLSEDPAMLQAFADGVDIHQITAAEVFGVALTQVTSEQRRSAKAINFGLMYGMSGFGLAAQLGITRQEAEQYINFYFAKFPQVKIFVNNIREFAAQHGYVETLFGRRLYLPDINSKNPQLRKAAERAAINAPMQGGQADIIKRAMIAIDSWLGTSGLACKLIMQVHDELVFEVADDIVDLARNQITTLMTNAASLKVPLLVSVGIAKNWQDAH